jgi:hypothetical protein
LTITVGRALGAGGYRLDDQARDGRQEQGEPGISSIIHSKGLSLNIAPSQQGRLSDDKLNRG